MSSSLSLDLATESPLVSSDIFATLTRTRKLYFTPSSWHSSPPKFGWSSLARARPTLMSWPLMPTATWKLPGPVTPLSFPGVSGVKNDKRHIPESATNKSLCYYHAKFGEAARKCNRKDCPLSHLVQTTDGRKVSMVGHRDKNTMTVWDRRSGRTYLVDCGADFSVFPASLSDSLQASPLWPPMVEHGEKVTFPSS